jgi:hypothetical protein
LPQRWRGPPCTWITARTYTLIRELDPPWVYEMDVQGMLEWLAHRFSSRAGLAVEVQAQREPLALPAQDRALLFRCIRELLACGAPRPSDAPSGNRSHAPRAGPTCMLLAQP